MTRPDTSRKPQVAPEEQGTEEPGTEKTRPEEPAHTELRPVGKAPRPRAKVLPREVRDGPGDDDPFNDVPV